MAGIFRPVVSRHGYSTMFLLLSAFTASYFLIAIFLLPETKGKGLEEIKQFFDSSILPANPPGVEEPAAVSARADGLNELLRNQQGKS